MKAKKSLQKFTDTETKFTQLLAVKKLTYADLEILSDAEKKQFKQHLNKIAEGLSGIEFDIFFDKIELIISEERRNLRWENNHAKITYAISEFLIKHGITPSVFEIAEKTGLSRTTTHKHLKEYASSPLYQNHIEQFKFLSTRLLTTVYELALNGDMGAAKLYFNIIGNLQPTPSNTLIQNQNNYIQINGTVLSQESIKSLNPEQLNSIECILKTAMLK
jgi:hypothetical protein